MNTCEREDDAPGPGTATNVAPRRNGDGTYSDLRPSVYALQASGRRYPLQPVRLRTSILTSLLFHLGTLAVLASPAWRAWRRWELQLPRGHNSVALAASVASPKSEATTTVQIANPEAAESADSVKRRKSEIPEPVAAQFASAVAARRVPLPAEARHRNDAEEPPEPEKTENARPKQTAEMRLPQRETEVAVESPASNPAVASAGANRDVPPKVVREVRAVYPAAAQAAGMQGVVKIHVRVGNRGDVLSASLHQSSGYELLDQAALEAILQYEFATFDAGDGIAAEFIYPIRFRLTR